MNANKQSHGRPLIGKSFIGSDENVIDEHLEGGGMEQMNRRQYQSGNRVRSQGRELEHSKSNIYKLSQEELSELFSGDPNDNFALEQKLQQLQKYKMVDGIIEKLASNEKNGIIGDEKDLRRRANVFGKNEKPLPVVPPLKDSIAQEIKKAVWIAMFASALFAGLCGAFVNGFKAFYEAMSICIVAVLIIATTALADWFKDKRFVLLQSMVKDEDITVLRGRAGHTTRVNVWSLVVGDIIYLESGQRVPADCLIVESSDLKVDETPSDGEIIVKSKTEAYNEQNQLVGDPFLRADSLVRKGNCKAMVCCVGKFSTRGEYAESLKDQTNVNTDLQRKLANLSDRLAFFALMAGLIIFVVLLIMTIVEVVKGDEETADGKEGEGKGVVGIIFSRLSQHFNLVVVMIVVAIPEGLPLTVGVSLAFSVMKMYEDNILVRRLDAPELMGGVDEICCGKTATITKNQMKVSYFYFEGNQIKNSRKNTFNHCDLSENTKKLIRQSIIYNNTALIEMDTEFYIPVGNGTEVGLLKFLQDADVPIQYEMKLKEHRVRAVYPFNSDDKISAVAVEIQEHEEEEAQVFIFMKGAPEEIMKHCPQLILGKRGVLEMGNMMPPIIKEEDNLK